MSASGFFPAIAGRPFTLWQDPDRWPKLPLRLPGRAFTLWLDPSGWPEGILRLPGRAYTVWLDPGSWPVPRLRLPGAGFTMWTAPESWPRPTGFSLPPLPLLAMTIQISQNKSFTLWTRPGQVTPIPMKNGLTASGTAAAGAGPVNDRVPPGPPRDNTGVILPSAHVPLAHRLLPLAAGIVAVLGLHALMSTAESKKKSVPALDGSGMQPPVGIPGKSLETTKASAEAGDNLQKKAAQMEAKALVLKEENDRLVTGLTQARESMRKAEGRAAEQDDLVRRLNQETNAAKLAAATADTKAQTAVVAAVEEASAIKRESAGEVVKLRESLARVEAEKAAALKAAASAASEKMALQEALAALKKPVP